MGDLVTIRRPLLRHGSRATQLPFPPLSASPDSANDPLSGTRRSSMRKVLTPWLAATIITLLSAAFLRGQTPVPSTPTPGADAIRPAGADATRLANGVAAVVDGEPIPE